MFRLSDADLAGTIVGCGDGPASFNAEATRRGTRVVSCDPVYRHGREQLRERIAATTADILEQTHRNAAEFVWTTIASVDDLGRVRAAAMQAFLDDFPIGKIEGRYVDAELPVLPFADGAFDLALSSHFLLLYTDQLGEAFHRAAIREMCRVAREVRIFPLLTLGAVRSSLVDPLADDLRSQGFGVSLDRVPYEFQRGGNEMMRIHRSGSRPVTTSM
jgi:hypothetical protein